MSSSPLVVVVLVLFTLLSLSRGTIAQPSPPGSCPCPQGQCCSRWGFCGTTDAYCGADCASQCPHPTPPAPSPPPPAPEPPTTLEQLINRTLFDVLLLHRNDPTSCLSRGFYTYDAFITAAKSFPAFGNTGSLETRKREIAAFFAQTSQQTAGILRPSTVPDGPYTWGYCFIDQLPPRFAYCLPSSFQCVPGKQYYGRGPMQFTNNYFYGRAGLALGYDLLSDPDALSNDAILSFKSALWFWMNLHPPRPSCHEVMTGQYQPSQHAIDTGRLPGYGLTTNVISRVECGSGAEGPNPREEARVGFYKRYCDIFGVSYGDNLYCNNQEPFPSLHLESM